MGELEELAGALRAADTAVAFTGAGISTASGIPDFRGEDGLWSTYDRSDFTLGAFEREPAAFWDRWLQTHEEILADGIVPNRAHHALASLEAHGFLDGVVTQNVDGLHRAAGSETVLELHGRGDRVRCRSCDESEPVSASARRFHGGERPPRCRTCDGPLKPATVLFGERLPAVTVARAKQLARDGDVFVVAGSSLSVEPAASLPLLAVRTGGTLAIVNAEPTDHDRHADHVFHEDVTDVLPALRDAVLDGVA